MTIRHQSKLLLSALLGIFLFAGCDKIDEEIDEIVTKYIFVTTETENDPDMTNVFLDEITIGGTTIKPAYDPSADITITDNVPYTMNIKTSPMTDALNFTTTSYSGTIPGSAFHKSDRNDVHIVIDNLKPVIYVNDVKVASANGGTGGGGNGGGTGGSKVDTLANQMVDGDTYDKKTFSFTIPAGLKNLSVRLTETNPNTDRNTADLFVRQGTEPIIIHNPPQNWDYDYQADCAGINPNREDELCSFDNPQAGTWYVTVYGYNTYFFSRMIITTTAK